MMDAYERDLLETMREATYGLVFQERDVYELGGIWFTRVVYKSADGRQHAVQFANTHPSYKLRAYQDLLRQRGRRVA